MAENTLDQVLVNGPNITEGQERIVGVYGPDTSLKVYAADDVNADDQVKLRITSESIRLSGDTGDEDIDFRITPTSLIFSDGRVVKVGIQYDADYSGDFTDRTLVDKGYVDAAIAAAIAALP